MSNHRELLEKSDIFQVGGAVLKIYPPTMAIPHYAIKLSKPFYGSPRGSRTFVKGIGTDRRFKDKIIQQWLKTFREEKKSRKEGK